MGEFTELAKDFKPINAKDPNYKAKVAEQRTAYMNSIGAGGADASNATTIKAGEANRKHLDGTISIDNSKNKEAANTADDFDDLSFLDDSGDSKDEGSNAATGGARKLSFEDEYGETIEEEITLEDEKLVELLKKAKKAEQYEADMAAMRDEIKSKEELVKKELAAINKWKMLEAAGNDAILNEILKEQGGIEGFKKQVIEENARYLELTDDERKEFDAKRERIEALKREKALQDKQDKLLKQIEQQQQQQVNEQFIQQLRANVNTVLFPNENKDVGIEALNTTMFNQIRANLIQLRNDGIQLTPAIMQRECKKVQATLKKSIRLKKGDEKQAKEYADKLDAATAAAQSIKTENKPAEGTKELYMRWMKLTKEGKNKAILDEVMKNPVLLPQYNRFGELMMKNKKW